MKELFLLALAMLATSGLDSYADGDATQAASVLQRFEEDFRATFPDLADELCFEHPPYFRDTLAVEFRTREYTVYRQLFAGDISEQPHEEVGPTHAGFRLLITVEEDGFAHQRMMPATLEEPYWVTHLFVRHPPGSGKQLFCRLSRGSRLDPEVLGRLTTFVTNLGQGDHDRLAPATRKHVGPARGESAPRGQLGGPLGHLLTIEGVRVNGAKVESNTLLVDKVNGQRLVEPVSVVVRCCYVSDHNLLPGRITLPDKTRCVLRGYEEFAMVGVPPAVNELADELDWQERPTSPTPWRWRPRFVALEVAAPAELAIERPTD